MEESTDLGSWRGSPVPCGLWTRHRPRSIQFKQWKDALPANQTYQTIDHENDQAIAISD